MVNVEFMDIRDDLLRNITMGPFESVQVTNGQLRDPEGNIIADMDYDMWVVEVGNRTVSYYSDFVITAA